MRHQSIDRSAVFVAGVKNTIADALRAGAIVGAVAAMVIAFATAFV